MSVTISAWITKCTERIIKVNEALQKMHAISVRSAYIDLNELDGCVFVNNTIITTNPQLDIVCSRLRELLTEPRWIVDYTAVMCAR